MYLKTCYSPCFWHPNVRSGSMAVALYSILMSICILTYTIYVMVGGDSSQVYLPLFEADLPNTMQSSGGFIIFFFLQKIISSLLLVWGIQRDIRALMIPWMVSMGFILFFQAAFGLWLIFGYYIYLVCVFAALVNWAWMAYNFYCFFCVRSHFTNVKWFQSPDIEVLDYMA